VHGDCERRQEQRNPGKERPGEAQSAAAGVEAPQNFFRRTPQDRRVVELFLQGEEHGVECHWQEYQQQRGHDPHD
jgi:hypothetical protein